VDKVEMVVVVETVEWVTPEVLLKMDKVEVMLEEEILLELIHM
jgi:hypothetical protein